VAPPTLGYLRDTVTNERLDFQFNPADLPVSLGANYATKTPRGASHPRLHFTSGEGRSESIALTFIRQQADAKDMVEMRRRLMALTFADYDSNGRLRRGPHPMMLIFGGLQAFRVKIKSVKLAQGPWFHPETTAPGELHATLEWIEEPETGDLSRDDILGGM